MGKVNSLRDIVEFNSNFKTAINLYLNLNRPDKILGYIPTKSSISFLSEYTKAVLENKEQATLLVGPYGKGKSHLVLVLLAILSLERTDENTKMINRLIEKIQKVDEIGERVSEQVQSLWNKDRFLPVLITNTTGDLKQAFLYGLNDALKRNGLMDLVPDTFYSIALERINDWEENYFETYITFKEEIEKSGSNISALKADLKMYSKEALNLFKTIYPKVTAGSEFVPLAISDVLPLYKSISEKLVEEYGYSGIYIVFDEFSKFIEGQDGTAAGINMKLLQDICELATDSKAVQVFITMIAHKSIKEYGKYLSQDIINSFITKLLSLNKRPLQNTRDMLKFVKEMIDNIRFCVIMTGNEKDAYTLFEVLNDRAMEIDDLELTKNLFLKTYCNTSDDIDDDIIDNNIGELDQIWGDKIFTSDFSNEHKKLVSYLGALYLTADETAFTNRKERYREIIEKEYLNSYSAKTNQYIFFKAFNDISVYWMIRVIIDEYNIPVYKSAEACIGAENNPLVSITFKTFHLLNALKLDGVMPALVNVIIRQYMNEMVDSGLKQIDINNFKKYVLDIKNDYQHNINEGKYRKIHELAFKLWKSALLCKDYEIPREIAKKGLQNISLKNWNPQGVLIDIETHSKMLSQFREWLQNWQYGKSKGNNLADLKLKVLFINLFKTQINADETELIFDKTVYSFVTDKLQLDHMEARRPSENNMVKHFKPKDPYELREKYVESLGNMMILDKDNNNEKNNKPLAEAMGYYENMCVGHWLNKLTTELLESYHTKVSIAGQDFKVPTEQFFNERSAKLIYYFEKILVRNLDTKKVKIQFSEISNRNSI